MNGSLRLAGVRVSIGEFAILRGVDLSVPAGAAVGLVGRNGAGKTTTLRSIMGLASVSEGEIALGEHDLRAEAPEHRARLGIGYLPEDRRLVPTLTARENVLLPAWAMGDRGGEERYAEVLRDIPELEELATRRASALSGGQQKVVALGRALMTARRLLLLDEPFEGVSPALAQRLAAIVARFRERDGSAVLLAESDVRRARYVAEQIRTIERGEVMANGEAG